MASSNDRSANKVIASNRRARHDYAIEDFSVAIGLNPNAAEPYYGRGVSYAAIGDLDAALNDLNRAVQLNSRYYEAWAARGQVLEQKGDKNQAATSYARALEINRSYGPAQQGARRLSSFMPKA